MAVPTSGIDTVKVVINGQTYNLTYNASTQKYEATITAPNRSSFNNNSGHYYPVTLTATDIAGNSVTKNDTDASLGNSLRLVVKETVAPTITNLAPSRDTYLSTSTPTISATLTDNDSGIDITTLILKLDDVTVQDSKITKNTVANGYTISYIPESLEDGPHTVSITVKDNDGNTATAATTNFTIATTPPNLTIVSPVDELKTNMSALVVNGTTNTDATIRIFLNEVEQGDVNVSKTTGEFSKTITLSNEGTNVVKIVAANPAGVETIISKDVLYDVTPPVISNVTLTPNPVDSGMTFVISATITDM